jgi:hypothetical protein
MLLYHRAASPDMTVVISLDSAHREHPPKIITFWNGGFRGLHTFGAMMGGLIGDAGSRLRAGRPGCWGHFYPCGKMTGIADQDGSVGARLG